MPPSIPSRYRDYIRTNGLFDGFTVDDARPGYVILWSIDEISEINSDIQIETYAPGFIAFAGNGGGEVLAFDERGGVHMLPLIGMAPEAAIRIADSFQDFASQFVR
ncbi:SMI1/KNR4 family protein [Herbaspirillum sp.]|uniref:SMI1/KNR4 family protein n=1 Tax=Herbaspirillum TaxID=963 RepID=UPI002589895F|nr:SMI1/KNR4 family protein [Herbaspirillum sp.]MCP3657870.1 SMI1/KNR4 family protein [Herbaspirillum sp.]MCP3946401.1 SMI1/KNR4 family protein [Herbaspirillum sp.]MCP4029609.1 SMI1/KNR4 family protein [Herbaspirillum sp.]MCP4554141.1 SMI1/KNR4 family protein [Herbaspirillum sp.]